MKLKVEAEATPAFSGPEAGRVAALPASHTLVGWRDFGGSRSYNIDCKVPQVESEGRQEVQDFITFKVKLARVGPIGTVLFVNF